jgi:hypothetical protein
MKARARGSTRWALTRWIETNLRSQTEGRGAKTSEAIRLRVTTHEDSQPAAAAASADAGVYRKTQLTSRSSSSSTSASASTAERERGRERSAETPCPSTHDAIRDPQPRSSVRKYVVMWAGSAGVDLTKVIRKKKRGVIDRRQKIPGTVRRTPPGTTCRSSAHPPTGCCCAPCCCLRLS